MAFDLSQLVDGNNDPVYSQITGLTLNLTLKQYAAADRTLSIYGVSQSSGNWQSTDDKATLWAMGYDAPALGSHTYTSAVASGSTILITLSGDLTGLIDSWRTGNNAGFFLQGQEDLSISGTQYEPNPQLAVEYTPVPEPATMAMLGFGGVMMFVRRRRRVA